jgi:hypothetical protein
MSPPAVGLLCSGGAPPQDQQAGLAASLQRSCVTFVTLCHACTAAAGPSLKESLVKLASDVIHPCLALIKDMVSSRPHCYLTDNPAWATVCLLQALADTAAVMFSTTVCPALLQGSGKDLKSHVGE